MSNVISQRLFKWAVETQITGSIDAAAVHAAAADYVSLMQDQPQSAGMVWLLDTCEASDFSFDALPAIQEQVRNLIQLGLQRVALTLSPKAMAFSSIIKPDVSEDLFRMYFFRSRDEAVEWMWRGCE